MNEENQFIYNDGEDGSVTSQEAPKNNSFPVKFQLVIIGFFLVILFGSVIIPKFLIIINREPEKLATVSDTTLLIEDESVVIPQKIDTVNLRAEAAYVWDVVGQRALYEENPDEKLPLASITKLMTALVAYELVADDTLVTISPAAASQESAGSLLPGEVYEVKDLADFALVSSYNSAAQTLAEAVGEKLGNGNPLQQFVAAMNIRASELNLQTHEYLNPTGLDVSPSRAGAYGSARETTFLLEYIYANYPEVLRPTVAESTRLYNQSGDYHEAKNTNRVLLDIPNLLGSKTGYTDLAGGNLTIIFDAGFNRPVIVTVLGSTHSERFSDVKKLVAAVQASMVSKI
ncbi:MAG TPA: serine hydrolase [Candidatus Paceibacterota bacterium]|nr:serine hydrolase [Candidatus Paceibacterota bacterium]HMO83156.1 serine hydrolase [Candidatus Paceibacterota bacterium]